MKITSMTQGKWGNIVAFFDVEITEGITAKGFKLIEKDNQLIVGTPSVKKDDGTYNNIVRFDKVQYLTLLNRAKEYYEKGGTKYLDPITF